MKDTATWSRVGQRLGTQPGGQYRAPDGRVYYVKHAHSDSHARNEVLASRLYALAGVRAAQYEFVVHHDRLSVASPWIDGAQQDLYARMGDDDYMDEIRKGFAVDVWLANWDVAGLVFDNIVSERKGSKVVPVRVDPGGCLLYRAMGAPKGKEFNTSASEWETLRDFGKAPEAAHLFATMRKGARQESASRVSGLTPHELAETVLSVGFDADTSDSLIRILLLRRARIEDKAQREV